MENVICPLCGNQNSRYIFSERGYDLQACQVCELFFIHPYPSDDYVHEKVVDYNYDGLSLPTEEKHYVSSKQYYRRYFNYLKQELCNAKSLLDVGCGTGYFLELLGKEIPKIHRAGIELNAQRAEYAKRKANCEIYETPLEKYICKENYDVITMINVLSHIPSIDQLFQSIRSLLNYNGKLILKVGEMSNTIKKDAIYDWAIPDHLHFLGLNTIQFICDKYGFKVLRHERRLYSEHIFSKDRWKMPGRSTTRNVIKIIITTVPFALSILKRLYELRHGKELYSSLIILSPIK